MNEQTLLLVLLLASFLGINALTPSNRGKLVLESSLSYIAFDGSIANRTTLIQPSGDSLHMLSRMTSESSEYLWLERNNSNPNKLIYQKTNHDKGKEFILKGFTAKGFVEINRDLKYIIGFEDTTQDLYILTLADKSELTYLFYLMEEQKCSATSPPYVVKERKKIPKTVQLAPELYIQSMDTLDSTLGRRIIIAGTALKTAERESHIFFAVYNTYFNTTEFLWEESYTAPEVCRGIEVAKNSQHYIYTNSSIETTYSTSTAINPPTWSIAVRGFSLARHALEWAKVLGHSKNQDFYAGSGIHGNFLFIVYNTDYSHSVPPLDKNVTEIELAVLRVETGEGLLDNCQTAITSDSGYIKALDLKMAGQTGIYLLTEVDTGNIRYIKKETNYTFNEKSMAILFFAWDDVTPSTYPVPLLLDIEAFPAFTEYKPTGLLLYYPSNVTEYGIPELLLLAHLSQDSPNISTGLLIYGFSNTTCNPVYQFPESHNPFATDQNCNNPAALRCLAVSKEYSLHCDDQNPTDPTFLAKLHTCTHGACPEGYYNVNGTCHKCHFMCKTCNGPLSTHCLSCDSRTYNAMTHECECSAYTSKGECVSSCDSSYLGYTSNKLCKGVCPDYTFHYVNYASASGVTKAYEMGVAGGTELLEFATTPAACLELPGPKDVDSIPDQFTVSLWVYKVTTWADGARTLLWGFNGFELLVTTSGGVDMVQFVLKKADGSTISTPAVPPGNNAMLSTGWNYIAAGVKRYQGKVSTILYITTDTTTIGNAERLVDLAEFSYPAYTNTLLLGCSGTYTPETKTLTTTPMVGYSAFVRDLVYQQRYNELASLHASKNRAYVPGLQMYKQILAYWRFDKFESVTGGYLTRDKSQSAIHTIILASGNPQRTTTTEPSLAPTAWDDLGICVDLFSLRGFPFYSTSPTTYAYSMIEYGINMNDPEILQGLFTSWDTLGFYHGGCDSGTLIQSHKISLTASGIRLESQKPMPSTVYGKFVDVCYFSAIQPRPVKLGQVYFLSIPQHVYPSHGASDKQFATTFSFTLLGGDQTKDDIIFLRSLETNVMENLNDTVLIDEMADVYPDYSIKKGVDGKFTKSATGLDPAAYTLVWRPGYANYKAQGELVEYKNLFTLWNIQDAPKARFELLTVGENIMVQNGVSFKAEFFYLNLVGPGQADGDQIIFCSIGCHYSNHRGPVFTRVNGKYPPVWLGEESGISNLLTGFQDGRLFICWRPSARATVLGPSEDSWGIVYEDIADNENRAYIRVNNLAVNSDLPEIIEIYPNVTDRVLRRDENIWFRLSKCGSTKTKPSSGPDGVPGKVQVWHIMYTSIDKTTYTTETIWEQTFTEPAEPENAGFTIGKLLGDSSDCKFALTELPFEKMIPGEYYMLVIYSNSFKSPITNKFFLGELGSGLPQLKYEFTYQEVSFEKSDTLLIPPTQTELEIRGTGIGDLTVNGLGIKRLFGIKALFYTTPPCSKGAIPASYTSLSFFNGSTDVLKFTDLDFSACNGSLSANIQLIKLFEHQSSPIWSFVNQTVILGTIGCHSSCGSCNGPTKYNCTSCATYPYLYLYQGECVTKCGHYLPIALPIYNSTGLPGSYECVSECPKGYFLDIFTKSCVQCNPQCRTCTSDSSMSCLSCKSMVMDSEYIRKDMDAKLYVEKYWFSNICTTTCPTILNDLSSAHENLVSTNNYTRSCYLRYLPTGISPISVSIQPLAYKQRLNLQSSTRLRALIEDPFHAFIGISWAAHPAEELDAEGFETSDERTFVSYSEEALNSQVVWINMNSLNFKKNGDEKVIVVKARTNDSMAVGLMEIFGNLVLDFKKSLVIVENNSTLKTMEKINMNVLNVEDPDDNTKALKFRVMLKPISLICEESKIPESIKDSFSLLAALPAKSITVYSSKAVLAPDKIASISEVYVPPLINGPQKIADGLSLNRVACEVTVIAEDRHQGAAVTKFRVNFTETYTPETRSDVISKIYQAATEAVQNFTFTWDLALEIANTFATVVPEQRTSHISYMSCSRDTQCGHGKCAISAGRSICECYSGYTGNNCQWKLKELTWAQFAVQGAIEFLNNTLLVPLNGVNETYSVDDTNVLLQLSNVLTGILTDPELASESLLPVVVQLCLYLSKTSMHVALRMDGDEKDTILKAFDAVIGYVMYHLRSSVYHYYLLSDFQHTLPEYEAEYAIFRETIADYIVSLRNGLYQFLNTMSVGQFAGDPPFKKKYGLFEVFLTSELKENFYNSLDNKLAIQLPSEKGFIKIPRNLLETVWDDISPGEEFMLRIVNWFDNPYLFSRYHPEVFTSVQSFAFLNCNGTEIPLNLSNPIVMFLPISNWTKNFPHDRIKCKLFNDSLKSNVTRMRTIKELQGTTIVKKNEFFEDTITLPEFVDDDGVSSYGNLLKSSDYDGYVPCAMYKSGEISAIVERRKTNPRPEVRTGFYYTFDPMDYWKGSLGFYACMGMVGLFGLVYFISYVLDKILIPKLEKTIEINRQYSSQNEFEMVQMDKSTSIMDITNAKLNKSSLKEKSKEYAPEMEEDDYGEEVCQDDIHSIEKRNVRKRKTRNVSPTHSRNDTKHGIVYEEDITIEKAGMDQTCEISPDESPKKSLEIGQGLSTQEATTTMAAMRTNPGIPQDNEETPENIFRNSPAKGLRKKSEAGKNVISITSGIEDVFSEEHVRKREEYQFTFTNLYLQGNLFTNLFLRTSTTFHRTTRCITLFLSIYLQMFWSAAFLISTQSPLDRPDDFKRVTEMVGEQMWLPFAAPAFTFILLYLFAVLFKVSDSRVLETKTFAQYKRLQYF